MCGVFGFVAERGGRFAFRSIQKIAAVTETRGAHAFGFAWLDSRGRLMSYRQQGRITDHLGLLSMARNSSMLIGHTRYATHGDPADNINNHPHACDGGWIVHNGVVRNYLELVLEHSFHLSSECDSETIARLIEIAEGNRLERALWAVGQVAPGPLALLGLWGEKKGTMVVARRGNPLHMSTTKDGIYLASLPEGLPGRPKALKDDTVRRLWRGKKGLIRGKILEIEGAAEEESGRTTHGKPIR